MSSSLSRAVTIGTALLGLSIVACQTPDGSPEPAEIETVDVGGSIDEGLDTSDDPVGYVPLEEVGGVLPVGYPPDLPVYAPSSLIDFGSGEGEHYVLLMTPDPPQTVRERLAMQLDSAGWSSRTNGGRWQVSKDDRSAAIRIIGDRSGSQIRIDYR